MRKIVIEPSFMEGHFMDAHIHNICEYLHPDIYIVAEGMFPKGPESNTINITKFKESYTIDGHRGFDYQLVQQAIDDNAKRFPEITFMLIDMDYGPNMKTSEAYYQVFTRFLKHVQVFPDDIIIPLECDMFFTEDQANTTLKAIEKLKLDQGLGASCKSFFEAPYVIFARESTARTRKLAFRYGTGQLYDSVMKIFFWEDTYRHLLHNIDLQLFHYEWIRPGKYFEARIAQLNRQDSLWAEARDARDFIYEKPPMEELLAHLPIFNKNWSIKYDAHDIIDHPKHIRNHETWKYYYGN